MAKKTEPQVERIYAWLRKGRKITPLQALKKFGTMRLAAYIHELRKRGHLIETTMVEVGSAKKRVAQYSLRHWFM